jgi:hypothetical protein
MDIFEELAVLSEGELRVRPRLGGQRRLLQCCALAGGRARHRSRLDVSSLAAQPQVAPSMVGAETPKSLATSALGIPRSTAASTLSLRSFE